MRKIAKSWFRYLGLILLVGLIWWLDPQVLWDRLTEANGTLLVAAILLILPSIGLKVVRWGVLLRCNGIAFPWLAAALAYCSSLYLGLLTPGRAGEFAKVIFVSRQMKEPVSRVIPSVLTDRLFDVYVLLVLLLCGLVLVSSPGSGQFLVGVLAVLIIVSLGLWALLSTAVIEALARWAARLGPFIERSASALRNLQGGLREVRGRVFVLCLGLTLVAYAVFFVQCDIVARALGLNLPIGILVIAVAAGSAAGFLPISVSNLGTRDAVIVAYLGTQGVAADHALSFSLLLFVVLNLPAAALGAATWWFAARQGLEPLVDQVSQHPDGQ